MSSTELTGADPLKGIIKVPDIIAVCIGFLVLIFVLWAGFRMGMSYVTYSCDTTKTVTIGKKVYLCKELYENKTKFIEAKG